MILAEIFRLAVLFLVTLTAAVNGSANAVVEAVNKETKGELSFLLRQRLQLMPALNQF